MPDTVPLTDVRRGAPIAWVTGAGKGIGRAVALRLAADGWTVAVSARSRDDLESLARDAEALAGSAMSYVLDVTDAGAVRDVARDIEAELGVIDQVVLNAGTHQPMTARDFSVETLRKLMEVNLLGTGNCLEAVLPGFIARGSGRIAVMASVTGYRGLPTSAAYGATKAGLINMCEAMRPQLDKAGVTLQVINPGFVDTPLTRKNDFPMPFLVTPEKAADSIVRGLASRRFEIAFPWQMAMLMNLFRLLPYPIAFAITRRMTE